ncbi:MAG: sigma-70 family RNA polymerase sigma factor [Polyangiaceae bacterium]
MTAHLVEDVFRKEAPRITASVMRIVGDLGRAEEIVQETLLLALERWADGAPESPVGWVMAAAKNRALDQLRRDRRFDRTIAPRLAADPVAHTPADEPEVLPDDLLRLVFTCCHPEVPRDSQVALTLRLLGGLTTAEIGRAFLTSEPTIAQRIVRAKRTIAERQLPYEVPSQAELPRRLPAVLEVVYLVFNEGYAAHRGSELLRLDLCEQALRLGDLLVELLPDEPELRGLCALMEIQASRARTRVGKDGELVLLADQDRRQWDRARIARALGHLARAAAHGAPGVYRLQAQIASCHAVAPSSASTDWPAIAALYGTLAALAPSPVVELNRAAAVSLAEGPEAGLCILDALAASTALRAYHLLPAARADCLRRLGRWAEAAAEYRRAHDLAENARERDFLARRAAECELPRTPTSS